MNSRTIIAGISVILLAVLALSLIAQEEGEEQSEQPTAVDLIKKISEQNDLILENQQQIIDGQKEVLSHLETVEKELTKIKLRIQ